MQGHSGVNREDFAIQYRDSVGAFLRMKDQEAALVTLIDGGPMSLLDNGLAVKFY